MDEEWEQFATFDDPASAEAVAGRLRFDAVPSTVRTDSPVPGVERFCVMVPKALAHRARWVMSLANASDAELGYLATGELPTEDSDDTQ